MIAECGFSECGMRIVDCGLKASCPLNPHSAFRIPKIRNPKSAFRIPPWLMF
jgi:hypothetical protein